MEYCLNLQIAEMMKLVDVPDSKSGVPWDVWVRLPLGTNMETNTKSYKILVTVSLFALVSLITIAMFAKVRYSTSPGRLV